MEVFLKEFLLPLAVAILAPLIIMIIKKPKKKYLVFLFSFFIITGIGIYVLLNYQYLRIINPVIGEKVQFNAQIVGEYRGIKDDIWVIVWPDGGQGKGWPQSSDEKVGNPAIKKDGKWQINCNFGGGPQKYEVVVYTANRLASDFLREKMVEWKSHENFPGLSQEEMPKGLKEWDRIWVVKKENVKITNPVNGSQVGNSCRVSGICTDVIDDIWVIVWPEEAPGVCWPQSSKPEAGSPAVIENGQWMVDCGFGGDTQSYDIAVYTAEPTVSSFLSAKMKEWAANGNFEGLAEENLPRGLREWDRIRVTKK